MPTPRPSGPRPSPRTLAPLLALPLLPLAGCAPSHPNVAYSANETGAIARVSYGVIVAMRPVSPGMSPGMSAGMSAGMGAPARNAAPGNVRASILEAVAGQAAANAADARPAIEFIIREDSGDTVSVVQTDGGNLHPGERVVLTRGAQTHIAHAS